MFKNFVFREHCESWDEKQKLYDEIYIIPGPWTGVRI